ncbi:MAG: flagellar hook-basal body complex protein [Fibrobacterota bacterium]
MVRSLYAAISGLRNHQVRLDVIGNNIANVNTTGFKAGRVTFEESMAQLLKGASRPPGFQGGTNPMQLGLGMGVGSIDTLTTQGNLESTGQITDLAIEGSSYFVVSNGSGNYYSRMGAFQFDAGGRMVLPTNGMVLQGKMAAQDGNFPVGTKVGDITIPFSQQAPAKETTFVDYTGNLNSDSEALGTVLYTQPFYHRVEEFNTNRIPGGSGLDNDYGAGGLDHVAGFNAIGQIATDPGMTNSVRLTGLHNGGGESLGIKYGDILQVTATMDNGAGVDETFTASFEVVDDPSQAGPVGASTTEYRVATLNQFLMASQDFLTGGTWRGGGGSGAAGAVIAAMPDGKIRVDNSGAGSTTSIKNLTITSNRPISRTFVSAAFSFNSDISNAGITSSSDTPDRIFRPAISTDTVYDYMFYDAGNTIIAGSNPVPQIFTANGTALDIQQGDSVDISAMIGDTPKNSSTLVFDEGAAAVHGSTTMQDILDEIRNTLNLPQFDGTVNNNLSVSMNGTDTDDDLIPEGALVLRGQPKLAFAIKNFSMLAENASPTTEPPTDFNTNMVATQLQAARNTGVFDTSIEAYDESGAAHTLTMKFTHTGIKDPATWNWEVSTNAGETIAQGRTGRITFALDGTPSSFTFDETGVSTVRINPNNGSNVMELDLNWGAPGVTTGITQYASSTTVAAVKQDGYTSGRLEEISIDEYGTIAGAFSNGISKPLAQILIADFRNPGGLLKRGNSVYSESSNSGNAVLGIAGISSSGKIKPGALELSNVELATEFTNMITTQRGYQSNARVITTSDAMLQELVNLVR